MDLNMTLILLIREIFVNTMIFVKILVSLQFSSIVNCYAPVTFNVIWRKYACKSKLLQTIERLDNMHRVIRKTRRQ